MQIDLQAYYRRNAKKCIEWARQALADGQLDRAKAWARDAKFWAGRVA